MKRIFVMTLAGVTGLAGAAEAAPRAAASDGPRPASIEAVRDSARAAMAAGALEPVQWRGKRNLRHGRGWRHRGYHNRGRWHGRRHYRRDRGAAVAAGVAGLAVGAIIAGSAARAERAGPSKRWCAERYRSYDWRSETYVGNDGRRRACP